MTQCGPPASALTAAASLQVRSTTKRDCGTQNQARRSVCLKGIKVLLTELSSVPTALTSPPHPAIKLCVYGTQTHLNQLRYSRDTMITYRILHSAMTVSELSPPRQTA